MIERISARLKELDLAPTAAALSVGLNRYYLYDLVTGRKKTLKGDELPLVAKALDCTLDYLIGAQLRPTAVCSAGGDGSATIRDGLPCPIDESYPALPQQAWVVSGDGMADLGIPNGASVIVVKRQPYTGEAFVSLDDGGNATIRTQPISSESIIGTISIVVTTAIGKST